MSELHITLPIFYPANARFSVDGEIGTTKFACDLSICKGACCTMPADRGAPIMEIEIPILEHVLEPSKKYLPEAALNVIGREGVWKQEQDGSYTIPTVGGRECVFVHYEEGIAFCAIQTAYRNGEITGYEKPISCHLYPIRIYKFSDDTAYVMQYEEIDECNGGRIRGEAEHIALTNFLQTPLVRALGEDRIKLLLDCLQTNARS